MLYYGRIEIVLVRFSCYKVNVSLETFFSGTVKA